MQHKACTCAKCNGGTPSGMSYVPERTWIRHRRATRALPPNPRAAVASRASLPENTSMPAHPLSNSVANLATASGPSTSSTEEDTSGSSAAELQPPDVATPASSTPELHARGPNGVRIPSHVFKDNIDSFVAYTFVAQHCRSREGTEYYMRHRRFAGTCRTPHSLNSMVESRVDLHTTVVD